MLEALAAGYRTIDTARQCENEDGVAAIGGIDEGESVFFNHYDPDTVKMIADLAHEGLHG